MALNINEKIKNMLFKNSYSTSPTNGYSANYMNTYISDLLEPVTLWTGAFQNDSTSNINLSQSKNNFKRLRIAYRMDWGSSVQYVEIPVSNSTQDVMLDMIYAWSGTTMNIRQGVLHFDNTSTVVNWSANRNTYRNLTTSAVTGGVADSSQYIVVAGIYGLKY